MSSFMEAYMLYHRYRTDAPEEYSQALAIQSLGHCMGYDAVHLIQPDEVHHNMYVGLFGPSSVSRKTTSQMIARRLFPGNRTMSEENSPEAFLEELSRNSQVMQFYGEFSRLLKASKMPGHYLNTKIETMNEIFNCDNYSKTLKSGEYHITNPLFSFNTTCTEEMVLQTLNIEIMSGGFLARFLLVNGKASPKPRQRLSAELPELKEKLMFILSWLSARTGRVEFEFTDAALKRYNEIEEKWCKKEKVSSFVARYLNYVIAVADLLVISDCFGYFLEGKWEDKKVELNKLNKLYELVKLIKLKNIVYIRHLDNDINSFNSFNGINPNNVMVPSAYVDEAVSIIEPCLKYAEELQKYVEVAKPVAVTRNALKKETPVTNSELMRRTQLQDYEHRIGTTTLIEQHEYFRFPKDVVIRGDYKKKVFIYCDVKNIDSDKCKTCEYKVECNKETKP